MAKIGRRPTDDQLLEGGGGGGAGAGISGTKWSKMPSFKGNSDAVSDIKKLTKDTSHLKGGARDASDEAKGRAATRTAVRAAGAAGVSEGTKAALNNTVSAKEEGRDSFKEMERSLREADADIESSKYGKGDKLKKGGMASSRADGCCTKGKTRGKMY
jgi:hypothetical protein